MTDWDLNRVDGSVDPQTPSSFVAAVGDRDLTRTVLQNFRQVLCFRTEDEATIMRLVELLGQVEVASMSYSQGRSVGGSLRNRTVTDSSGSTVSWSQRNVINPQLFRQMGPDHALALLSIGGRAYDDVLRLDPVYVGGNAG